MTNFEKIKSFDFDAMFYFLCDWPNICWPNICEYCKFNKEICRVHSDVCREAVANWLSAQAAENTKQNRYM